ncbi:MAG: EscU/YscU/HrcU family type III secretion system export apparatus switch protein [Pseudomonadota bacterium]
MAEESDYSRNEPASERRLERARAEGNVPRSSEWSSLLVLGAAAVGLMLWGAHLFDRLQQLFAGHFRHAAQLPLQSGLDLLLQGADVILPFLIALFVMTLAAPLLMSGWVFAPVRLRFRGERLHLFAALARMFSASGAFDSTRAILKITILAALLLVFCRMNLDALAGLQAMPLPEAVSRAGAVLAEGLLFLLAGLLPAVLLDVPWQWWRHLRGLAMTRAETLAEAREDEGSPQLKARILARRQAMRREAAE